MTAWIYRVDFSGLDAAGASTSFSYATSGYTAPASHATKPSQWFDGRLDQPLLLRRDLYGQGRTYGDVQIPHGTVVLNNSDGGLDGLLAYGFDAQTIEVWKVDPADLATDLLEFRGSMEQVVLDEGSVTIRVRDVMYVFDRALQSTKYAGNNSLPNGLEGTSLDIVGLPKPIAIGSCFNLEPVLVNTSRFIYQWHDGLYSLVSAAHIIVYDKRSTLAQGISRALADFQAGSTDYTISSIDLVTDIITFTGAHGFSTGDVAHVASTDTLPSPLVDTRYYYARNLSATTITLHNSEAGAIANTGRENLLSAGSGTITVAKNRTPYGRYDWCTDAAGSYVRLGLKPEGRVTMFVQQSASYKWYDVISTLANRFGTYSIDRRVTAAAADFDVGHYWKEETTALRAIMEVLRSANASMQLYANRGASSPLYLSLQRLEVPGSPERVALDTDNIKEGTLRRGAPTDQLRGIPPWRVNVNYQKNQTIMTATDIAAAEVSQAAILNHAYLTDLLETAAIKLKYPAAAELIFDTAILDFASVRPHTAYLRTLYVNADRALYTAEVDLSVLESLLDTSGGLSIPGLLLNDVVKVTYPRFGLDSGKYLAVLGYTTDLKAGVAQLTLWG